MALINKDFGAGEDKEQRLEGAPVALPAVGKAPPGGGLCLIQHPRIQTRYF